MPYTNILLGYTSLATEEDLIEWYNDLREYFVDLYSRLEQLEERSGTSEDTADKLRRDRKSDRTEISKLSKKVETLTGLLDQFGQRLDRIEKQIASPAFEKEIESMFQRQFERFEQSLQTRASGPSPEKPSPQDR
jgi:septal ring factor EnvC (AmiA/AmiB activator)